MENTSSIRQLPSWRPRDLALLDSGTSQRSQWPATNPRPAGVRLLTANGVQLQRGADACAMSSMAMATKAIQGGQIAVVGGVYVTDIKFVNRLGPPPLGPPV
jgi:hypothetical protein